MLVGGEEGRGDEVFFNRRGIWGCKIGYVEISERNCLSGYFKRRLRVKYVYFFYGICIENDGRYLVVFYWWESV